MAFFSEHLQIQHEMRSVPKWGGDTAEQKQTEALRLNKTDLNSCKNQMTYGHSNRIWSSEWGDGGKTADQNQLQRHN